MTAPQLVPALDPGHRMVVPAAIHPWALADGTGRIVAYLRGNGQVQVCTYRTERGATQAQRRLGTGHVVHRT